VKLTRESILNLNQALTMKDLKAKHVSGDNYLKILKLKKELSKLVSEHGEQEKSVIEDLGLPHDETKCNFD